MTAAGTTYWAPSLAGRLPLSPSDKALFTAAIGVGYITCVLPGLIQTSLHPRSSALLGSLSLSLTYLLIAAVLHLSPPSPIFFLFPLARKYIPSPPTHTQVHLLTARQSASQCPAT